MMTARILVVDDDAAIRSSLAQRLGEQSYSDLVLTDLAMPNADGFSLIYHVRASGDTPIVVLSVRGGDADKIRALDLGADDFVVKPFSTPELLARIRAQLRRIGSRSQLEFPDLSIDLERRRVVQGTRELRLTPTELAILELLAHKAGRPVTFDEIIAAVWKGAPGTTNDAVRVHVGALRRKIEPDPSNPRYLVTEPWIGYRFIAEPLSS
ncbi:MAG: DNA-binding response regulator [Acidobacteria bacterium]|nr:MAG: DNA-binding response regulator [Acidobacteriota bacterium]